jgi:mannose/fructose/N-acetylgalactosamine-specific phosphotransferase system component IIC
MLLEDCNQAATSGNFNKLKRLVWVILICVALQLLVIASCKCVVNSVSVCSHLRRGSINRPSC